MSERKIAKEAMRELSDYLRRDVRGTELLKEVSRYIGSLREDCERLVENATTANHRAKKATTTCEEALSRCDILADALKTEQSANRQLAAECNSRKAEADKMEADYQSAVDGTMSEILPSDEVLDANWVGLIREFVKTVRSFPKPRVTRLPGVEMPCYAFDMEDLVRDFSRDECLRVGMFVLAFAGSTSIPVAFMRSTPLKSKDKGTKRLARWMAINGFLRTNDDESKMWNAVILKNDVLAGRYGNKNLKYNR